jgi:hypothetical protein
MDPALARQAVADLRRDAAPRTLFTQHGDQGGDPASANEGIVEEVYPSARHVSNYFLFYGAGKNPFKLARNMIAMLRSVTAFPDLHRIRTTMTSEYILKS